MNDFQFDLSDEILEDTGIKIELIADDKKAVKKINRISDLTTDQKTKINNILWYNESISNVDLIELLEEDFGLSTIIATNLVLIHRTAYLQSKGYYTIFDRDKKVSTFTKKSTNFFNNKYKHI